MTELGIKIEVPYKLQNFLHNPTPRVNALMKEADKDVLELLKRDISEAAPRKSGELAGSIDYDLDQRKIYSKSVYARAVELGHYAEPVRTPKKMFLKFKNQDVFLKYVRTQKQPFFFKTLDKDTTKIQDIYEKVFNQLP